MTHPKPSLLLNDFSIGLCLADSSFFCSALQAAAMAMC